MSLSVKDIVFSGILALAGAGVLYVQYLAPYALQAYRVPSWAALGLSGILFLSFSELGKAFIVYLKEAKAEVRKVVWPPRQDVISTTIAVGIAVVIFSVLVSILDSVLVRVLATLIG